MALFSFMRRPRSWLFALCSLLLHVVAVRSIGAHIGEPLGMSARAPEPMVVRMRLAPAKPAARAVPPPRRAAAPRPTKPATPGLLPAAAPETVKLDGAAPVVVEADPQLASAAPVVQPGEPPTGAAPALPEEPPQAAPEEAPKVEAGPPRYRVDVPPSAEMLQDLVRVEKDGSSRNGVASISWQTDGASYRMRVTAGVKLLVTLNIFEQTSEGLVDEDGIAPQKATDKRLNRSMTAVHFNRPDRRISFSASERVLDMLPGAQDQSTLPFQLAGIGRADPAQFQAPVDIQVGEARDASVFRFHMVGEQDLDLPVGQVKTVHLVRPPKPGSYSSRIDVWLAPALGWYPVQVRHTDSGGGTITQTLRKLSTSQGK
jgi:hypothetical protein